MNRSLSARIMSLLKRRQLKETLAKIAMVLSCMAIFSITYMLIAPVLTQEWVAECGMKEHTHTSECYTLVPAETADPGPVHTHSDSCYSRVRVENPCPVPEHVHTDGCYANMRGANICGSAEHVHTDGCYMKVRGANIICAKTEHVHTENCRDAARNLICEAEEHTHVDDCFEVEKVLTCTTEVHTHDDNCFVVERTLTCAAEEHRHSDDCYSICGMKAHTHADGCRDAAGNLVCGMEEHIHTDECFRYEDVLICGQEETAAREPEAESVLTCGMEEHTHTSECYPSGENTPDYKCGFGTEHTHVAECYFESGALKCTIPEHVHDAGCLQERAPEQPSGPVQPDVPAVPDIPDGGAAETPVYTCGILSEHTHSASCYENGVLICTLHVHDDSCLPVYTCKKTAHIHSASCPGNGVLCITPVHIHNDSCMPDYACGYSAHTHGESCYDENGSLICTMHVHDVNCLPAYTCGFRAHTHSGSCYGENGAVICTIPAHTHDENCLPKTPEAPGEAENPNEPVLPVLPVTPDEGYTCGFRAHTHSHECYERGEDGQWKVENNAFVLKCGLPEHVHNENCLPQNTLEMPNGPVVIADVMVPGNYQKIDVWNNGAMTYGGLGETSVGADALVYAPKDAFSGKVVFMARPLYEEESAYRDAVEALSQMGADSSSIVAAMDLSFFGTEDGQEQEQEPQTGPVYLRLTMPIAEDLPEGAELKLWHQTNGGAEQVQGAVIRNEFGTLTVEFMADSFSTYALTSSVGETEMPSEGTRPVSWSETDPAVACTTDGDVTTWDISNIQNRYLDIPVRIDVAGLTAGSTITLPYTLDAGRPNNTIKPTCQEPGNTGAGWTLNTDSATNRVVITINNNTSGNTSGHQSIDIYYRFDCWNVVSGQEFTISCTVQKLGAATAEPDVLKGKIITGHDVTFGTYANDWGDSDYSFSGFGGADKASAYILGWNSVYETYFGLSKTEFDNEHYVYDIAPFLVSPTGQQPYSIKGTFTPDQNGELIGGVYMMDSAKKPDELCVKIPASEPTTKDGKNQYSFTIESTSLNRVVSSLSDETDNKTYTLYFLVRYPRASMGEDVKLNAELSLTHTGIDSKIEKSANTTACLYDGPKNLEARIYWASYVSDNVKSSTGLTSLKGGSTATLDFAADFFCLNEARPSHSENDRYRLEAIIDLSYRQDGKTQLSEGEYRFSSFNLSLIDAKATWSQDWDGGAESGWLGTPNVGWTMDKFTAPSWAANETIEVYGSTSLTGNSWAEVSTVNASEVWAANQNRGFTGYNTSITAGDYVRLKVVYNSRYTTALRVGYQMEVKPSFYKEELDSGATSVGLTCWFNYLAYTASNDRDTAMAFNRYPVTDTTWDKIVNGNPDGKIDNTLELARQHDEKHPYPAYDAPEDWYSQNGYSLRNFAKAELGSSAEAAGMIVTQALYDSSGKIVGNPTSIDPNANDSYSLKTDVVNVSEIVYSISGAVTNGANSLEDLTERIKKAEEGSPYKSLTMRYYVLLPEGLKLNTNPDNGETDENGAPKYHFWTGGTTDYLSANSAFYNSNSEKVVQGGQTDVPVSAANIPGWKRISANGSLSEMYWVAGGAVTHDISRSSGQLVVFERTLGNLVDYDRFNMWGTSETYVWGRGLSFSVVPKNGTGSLPAGEYEPQFWCQYLDGDGNPISLSGFGRNDNNVNAEEIGQNPDTLLYIPISFTNKHHEGGSQGEIKAAEIDDPVILDDGTKGVKPGGTYKYPLTYEVGTEECTNVVLWCNIEEMSYYGFTPEWHGTLTGVDLNHTDAEVYVKTDETFRAETYDDGKAEKQWLRDGEDGWTKVPADDLNSYDWSKVKAIAFSFEGKVFKPDSEHVNATVYLNMQAPEDDPLNINGSPKEPGKTEYTTYNELLVSDVQGGTNNSYFPNYVPVTIKVTPVSFALPSTGGPGTTCVYATGAALMLTAAYLMYQPKRRCRKTGRGETA